MQIKYDFHFIAIGGVGQSALAKILLQLGYKVSGSDIQESKYTHLVEDFGAKVFIGHKKENIISEPKIVVSSAINEQNPEIIRAKELGLEILHRSDCLRLISKKFDKFIGFSGTHGKTTTSGLASFILEKINQKPAYAIGGVIPFYNINAKADKNSKYFIAELDESDGTIEKYSLDYLVINNLEADHLDFYKNGLEDIFKTFDKVVSKTKENAKIFINSDDEGCCEFVKRNGLKNYIAYGIDNCAKYQAKNIVYDDLEVSFDVYREDSLLGRINLIIPGKHNIYNALSVISVLEEIGFEFDLYSKYFSEFSGMGRRFQLVADIKGIKIIDDYAHHPSEIKSTLSAIKETKRRKVIVFQPHRYTRLKGLWTEFLNSFQDIDKLFVTEVFRAGDVPLEDYNAPNFVKEIAKRNVNAQYIQGNMQEVSNVILPELKEGDLLLILGAGDVTRVGGMINDLLST